MNFELYFHFTSNLNNKNSCVFFDGFRSLIHNEKKVLCSLMYGQFIIFYILIVQH